MAITTTTSATSTPRFGPPWVLTRGQWTIAASRTAWVTWFCGERRDGDGLIKVSKMMRKDVSSAEVGLGASARYNAG